MSNEPEKEPLAWSLGEPLYAAAHPVAPWWKRLWFWLRRPNISSDAVEDVEIEL